MFCADGKADRCKYLNKLYLARYGCVAGCTSSVLGTWRVNKAEEKDRILSIETKDANNCYPQLIINAGTY